ncbi:hypothetical protein ACHAWT_010361 [Skeletonema menzelii]
MDFLSLESALLLQGGTPYFGYGWSDPSSSGNKADDGTVDGSIYGPSNAANSRGVGVAGGDYYSHGVGYGSDNHVAKLQTPLDPLLKELKREHASSAGPQDVLASLISKEELEFLFKTAISRTSTTKSSDGSGGKKFPVKSIDVPETGSNTKKDSMDKDSTDLFDISRAETPLARGGQLEGTSPNAHPTSLPSNKSGIHQNISNKRPFSSHVENLLQTTPHLRHLTAASTDLSGSGLYDDSKNIFSQVFSFKSKDRKISSADTIDSSSSAPGNVDYATSILRQRANRRASLELASFMRLLSNEMPQEAFVVVEAEVYKKVFSLMQSKTARSDDRLAGVAAVDALLSVPSSNEETKAIRVGNALSNGLKAPNADYEFLHAVARAIGRMAVGSTNVDLVEFEITRSLEWLQSDRSDRKLAAVLVLNELAKSSPTAFYSKTNTSSTLSGGRGGSMGVLASYLDGLGLSGTNEFLENIFPVLTDPHPIVRVCAADALSECLKILMDRQQRSMTAPLCKLHFQMMDGLQWTLGGKVNDGEDKFKERDNAIKAHGSLLVVMEMLHHSRNFILPRFDEVCTAVLKFTRHPMALIRLELIRIIPQLAQRNPDVYGCRYLCQSLDFLLASASAPPPQRSGIDLRPKAFLAIGQLALGMSDEDMGGGDITIPTVRIFDKPKSDVEAEDEDEMEYHIVDLEEESVFQQRLGDIFELISESLKRNRLASLGNITKYRCDILICFASMVDALGQHATPYVKRIVEDMFRSGLSKNLIGCLHSVAASLPSMQLYIERRLFEEVSFCLAGTKSLNSAYDLFSANENIRPAMPSINEGTSVLLRSSSPPTEHCTENNLMRSMSLASMNPSGRPRKRNPSELEVNELSSSRTRSDSITQTPATSGAPSTYESGVVINTSTKPEAIDKLILSLETLRTIGESYMRAHETENGNMLLPFLRDVISLYLDHPSSDVRREAAVTCSLLLLPFGKKVKEGCILSFRLGSVSGGYVEEILQKLLRIAVSDLSPVVRLCVVSGLDERYDPYLSQLSLLPPLFLMLEDETLVMRACALQLLGRLSRLNPATILPGLRIVLTDLILELQCGGDGGGKEAATRLIIVFLREEALQQLVRPFISSIIDSLPLSDDVPRLVSASLEALGELADVAHGSIKPWLRQLIPHILSNVEEQNSSKQKVSLWALGKIAFGTNYVISPYLDYPKLLSQASNILPTTKRASWELRREVFRTFGVLGALDPDRFGSSSTRKGGGKGGGYFVELDEDKEVGSSALNPAHGSEIPKMGEWSQLNNQALSDSPQPHVGSDLVSPSNESGKNVYKDSDNDEPAHLYMYEQYAMTAQSLSKLPPARRLSPSDDDFYPTVAVQALMRILRDSSLSNLHGMVMKAVMFIFNALGLKSVPFLKNIVPHILSTIKVCGQHGLREVLLQQVANLSAIVREHLRPYLPAIFDVVEEFWFTRHLSALCSLVKRVAIAVPDDFNTYVPLLVRQILATIDSTDFSGNAFKEQAERLDLILQLIQGIKGVLGEYIHLVVPALVKLTDLLIDPDPDKNLIRISPPLGSIRSNVAVETVGTLSILLETMEMSEGRFSETIVKSSTALPARVVQPFLRMLGGDVKPNKTVGSVMIDCLCICVRQLGSNRWMSFYHSSTLAVISSWQTKVGIEMSTQGEGDEPEPRETAHHQPRPIDLYKDMVVELVSSANRMRWTNNSEDGSLPAGLSLENSGPSEASLTGLGEALKPNAARNPPSTIQVQNQIAAHQTNINNLQRAWDVSQRSSREDWDEWLRRFSVQLLREAPSPALRACAELAQAYQPLARELFSAAFACCWVELDDHYRSSLIFSMETVIQADASQISLEILQLLLNLAEFLEKNKKTELPIDISIIAELALKCRAYARALHYKEREYIMGRGGSCVEQLIDINKKLDLPEAALGVLQAAKIEIQRHNRAGDQNNSMAYSVLNTIDGDKGSWAGDIMYESWLAKLGSWGEAVQLYEQKLMANPNDVNSILGCMQCYEARGDWEKALDLAGRSWSALSGDSKKAGGNSRRSRRSRKQISEENHKLALKHCAQAAWRLGKWDELETFSSQLVQGQQHASSQNVSFDVTSSKGSRTTDLPTLDYDSAFYRAVINIHREEWDEAAISIDAARKAMDSRFTALLAESYQRAYPSMVAAQRLSELEEIVSFRQFELRAKHRLHTTGPLETKKARQHLTDVWRRRLNGCRVDAEVHSEILAVRSLVLGPADEVDATITLSALSRQAEAYQLAERTLLDPLTQMEVSLNSQIFGIGTPSDLKVGLVINPGESAESLVNKDVVRIRSGPVYEQYCQQLFNEAGGEKKLFVQHKLYFAYIKHLWATERKDEAMSRLSLLCNIVDLTTHYGDSKMSNDLRIKCWLRFGDWKLALNPPGSDLPESLARDVLVSYKRATDVAISDNYRAFHSWALINFRLAEQINDKDRGLSSSKSSPMIQHHVIAAVKGFVRAISVGTKRWSASVQQDLLNLLSCLFKYGDLDEVSRTIKEGLESIEIEAWLGVLPQLLARIHIKSPSVRSVLHPLLVRLGTKHPQAMMYPLSVLLKSPVTDRKLAAESLMNSLKTHSNALIEESLMVSSELIRVAILWLELWHEGLEDASRLYYGEGNVAGMLDVLIPLHTELEKGANSRRELDFLNSFGRDLMDAHNHITEYVRLITSSGQTIPTQGGFMSDPNQASRSSPNAEAEAALNQAWDLYYTVFRRINKQLPGMTTLELDQCSPALFNARNLELGVPGSYRVDGSYVKIQKFITSVQVITSKQRPRKITIRGNDGKDYVFLLKGHEDLRQDERVMQLFGLVNALLARDRRTNKHDLNIQRYAIAPLSHNAGVVGWVPHCDTLHCLIRDYREALKIPLNAENREMLALTPNYDSLTAMQKVEVFTEALERTKGKGNDLYEVLWNKSINSEEWLDRRTNFTRSLAVMSMVGYILGLGDRHPSNLMLDQVSGRVLHIDFGDCFEVAMHREKFPEKVPFRLTRMLVRAMEVSGIEGSYKSTCERTMSVLRDNKDSLVAMLEAFVYDPLISWRLLDQSSDEDAGEADANTKSSANDEASSADDHRQDTTATTTTATGTSHPNTLPEPIQEEHDEDGENEDSDSDSDSGDANDDHVDEEQRGDDEENDSDDKIEEEDKGDYSKQEEGNDKETNDVETNDEDKDEESNGDEGNKVAAESTKTTVPTTTNAPIPTVTKPTPTDEVTPRSTTEQASSMAASHARSLQMYSDMRALSANLSTSSRIASITGGGVSAAAAIAMEHAGSMARSRIARSLRQRSVRNSSVANDRSGGQIGSNEEEDAFGNNDEALNEKALKVIRRVQDKLTGTDFHSPEEEFVGEPLDVQEQVQRLIVQATSSENLCQLFIGWCAFW